MEDIEVKCVIALACGDLDCFYKHNLKITKG